MATSSSVFREYSSFNPIVLEKKGRLKIARQIWGVLRRELSDRKLTSLALLDIGCSSGIITNYLSEYFGQVYGLDNDENSITIAKKNFRRRNLHFSVGDAIRTGLPDESFDVVVANQVYYCFEYPGDFIKEVFRVVKNGGLVFFGARNKYTLWDAQYHLPLLAFLPKFLADFVVRIFGRSDGFSAKYMDYWQLAKLTRNFEVKKITPDIIKNPNYYGFRDIAKIGWLTRIFPANFWRLVEPVFPNFIWILRKK